MEFIGIGFILLCYYFGKSSLIEQQAKAELAAIAPLPEEVRKEKLLSYIARHGDQ